MVRLLMLLAPWLWPLALGLPELSLQATVGVGYLLRQSAQAITKYHTGSLSDRHFSQSGGQKAIIKVQAGRLRSEASSPGSRGRLVICGERQRERDLCLTTCR